MRSRGPRSTRARLSARSCAALLLLVALPACAGRPPGPTPFGSLVEKLSEPGGYFDTDNLISNESSYLHAVTGLRSHRIQAGAYIGVGPDQNFSYMAAIRPEVALIVDIRRDNMLEHLIFKALFERSRNRMEYLCLLFARPPPSDLASWDIRDVEQLVGHVAETPSTRESVALARAAVDETIAGFGVALSESDLATIDRFHRAFIVAGPALRFTSHGRRPRFYYPTYRDLVLERDLQGERASYLVSEDDFQFLKRLQEEDRVVPVVGDLAGDQAMAAVGEWLAGQELTVSAFYTSNVEFYLFRAGTYGRFVRNVGLLPLDDRSVVIRSVFQTAFGPHPNTVPGYFSAQTVQWLAPLPGAWSAGGLRSYWDVVTRDLLR